MYLAIWPLLFLSFLSFEIYCEMSPQRELFHESNIGPVHQIKKSNPETKNSDFLFFRKWVYWFSKSCKLAFLINLYGYFLFTKTISKFLRKKIRVCIFRIGCLIWRTNKFIVPDVIANTPSEFLKVTYSNDEEVVPGSTLTYEEILGKETPNTLCF